MVKNVKGLRLFIHTKLVGLMGAECHGRQRGANVLLLHDSVPREFWIELMPAAYTHSALCYRRSLSSRNRILSPGQHRCFAAFSQENHPPQKRLYKKHPNSRQPALCSWAVQTENIVMSWVSFLCLSLCPLDQAAPSPVYRTTLATF